MVSRALPPPVPCLHGLSLTGVPNAHSSPLRACRGPALALVLRATRRFLRRVERRSDTLSGERLRRGASAATSPYPANAQPSGSRSRIARKWYILGSCKRRTVQSRYKRIAVPPDSLVVHHAPASGRAGPASRFGAAGTLALSFHVVLRSLITLPPPLLPCCGLLRPMARKLPRLSGMGCGLS